MSVLKDSKKDLPIDIAINVVLREIQKIPANPDIVLNVILKLKKRKQIVNVLNASKKKKSS